MHPAIVIGSLSTLCGLVQAALALVAATLPDGAVMALVLAAAAVSFLALGAWGIVAGVRDGRA